MPNEQAQLWVFFFSMPSFSDPFPLSLVSVADDSKIYLSLHESCTFVRLICKKKLEREERLNS